MLLLLKSSILNVTFCTTLRYDQRKNKKNKCKVFVMKISFYSYANKNNFHMKSFALTFAFMVRFTATQKWPIIIKFGELCFEFLQVLLWFEKLYHVQTNVPSLFKHREVGLKNSSRLPTLWVHAMQIYLENVDVPRLLDTVETCAEKVSLFENIVKTGLDIISPPRSKTILRSEPPWLNDKLKNLIKRRQCALAKGNMDTFRMLRNCVNRERKICRAKYYEAKVSHLRECKPSVWWKEVKKLSGMSPASETRDNTSKLLRHLRFSPGVLANYINSAFLTPMQDFEPLTHNPFDPPQANNESHAVNMISEFSTFMKLSALNPSKAHGPDGIPAWLLKENADLLAGPVSTPRSTNPAFRLLGKRLT